MQNAVGFLSIFAKNFSNPASAEFHIKKRHSILRDFKAIIVMDNPNENKSQSQQGQHEHALPQEISDEQRKLNKSAHDTAETDMNKDLELTAHSKNDDLDEGETARLGEDIDI